jgi:arabinose-5-phosphate isomerase
MTRKDNIGLTLVVDASGKLTGILTDGDIRRVLLRGGSESAAGVLSKTAASLMTRRPRIIDPESSAAEALRIMEVHGITSLAVVNPGDMPEGVIHLHDILGRGKFHL